MHNFKYDPAEALFKYVWHSMCENSVNNIDISLRADEFRAHN